VLLRGFFRGVLEKWVLDGGFLMVKSWWNVANSWTEDGPHFAAKNTPPFTDIF
jgi:hypothetical protein